MESGSTSSISTAALENYVDKLKTERNRDSTRKMYYAVWRSFNEFFIKLDVKPQSWEDRLILFMGYLINKNRKESTVKSYISAIKAVLRDDNVILNENKYLLSSLTRACRYKNETVRIRLPIQRGLHDIILKLTEEHFQNLGQLYLEKLYRAMFAAAYYGLLRVGEIAAGSHPVLVPDVHVGRNKRKLLFVLQTSKTHWEKQQASTHQN